MARNASRDPLDKFRWIVEIDGFERMGFASVETPSLTVSVKSYVEGGNHLFPKKIVDGVTYNPIALTRGVFTDIDFDRWAKGYINILFANSKDKDEIFEYRRDVTLYHLDRAGNTVKKYILRDAFPIEYKPASDFSAEADDGVSLERMVLTYERFTVEAVGTAQENLVKEGAKLVDKLSGVASKYL